MRTAMFHTTLQLARYSDELGPRRNRGALERRFLVLDNRIESVD
jgi:hypothetical protein